MHCQCGTYFHFFLPCIYIAPRFKSYQRLYSKSSAKDFRLLLSVSSKLDCFFPPLFLVIINIWKGSYQPPSKKYPHKTERRKGGVKKRENPSQAGRNWNFIFIRHVNAFGTGENVCLTELYWRWMTFCAWKKNQRSPYPNIREHLFQSLNICSS